jgi:hypothetical protein
MDFLPIFNMEKANEKIAVPDVSRRHFWCVGFSRCATSIASATSCSAAADYK